MEKIEFKDLPNTTTPINADNLNLLQDNVENEIEKYQNIPKTSLTLYNSSNLNDYVETGWYSCGGNTPINSPNNAAWNGVMLVFKSYYVLQIIVTENAGMWSRVKVGNNWRSWVQR